MQRAWSTCTCLRDAQAHSRRRLLRWGFAVPLLGTAMALGMKHAKAAANTEVLLLSCMDYRLMDDVARYMSGRGLEDKYDHVVLAGASLGATSEKYPAWNKTFWDHVDLAVQLHQIQRVILVDHRDCGAYKLLVGADHNITPNAETVAHARHLLSLRSMLKERYPKLEVETLLMSLDGSVSSIG